MLIDLMPSWFEGMDVEVLSPLQNLFGNSWNYLLCHPQSTKSPIALNICYEANSNIKW